MLDKSILSPYILSMESTIRSESITQFAQYYSNLTGDPWEFIFAKLLMLASQNLGMYVEIPYHPRVKAYPNLYIILIAPPGVHHKSTIINHTKAITKRITENIENEDYVKSVATNLAGSPEGFLDHLNRGDKIDLYNDEFGRVLANSSRGTYESGLLEILNNAYYKQGTSSMRRELKQVFNPYPKKEKEGEKDGNKKESTNRDLVVPDGKYVTFFGAIHEDEMTNEMYRIGMIRRSLIIYLSYESVNTSPVAYDREANMLADAIEEALVKMLSEARIRFNKWSYQPVYEEVRTEDGEIRSVLKYKPLPIHFEYSEEAIEFLKELYSSSMENAKREQRQLYLNESVELIMRVAINIMLWNAMRKEKYTDLVLTKEDLIEAKEFMEKLTSNYIKAVSSVEDKNTVERAKKIYNYVQKKCNKPPYYINQGEVMNAIGSKWENFQRENAIRHAIGENKIGRFEVVYSRRRRSGYILFPYSRIDDVIAELEKLEEKGVIEGFKEVK